MDSEKPEEAIQSRRSRLARWLTDLVIFNAIVAVAAILIRPFGRIDAVVIVFLLCATLLALSIARAFVVRTYHAWVLPVVFFLPMLCVLPDLSQDCHRGLTRSVICHENLHAISVALLYYEAAQGSFPPVYVIGSDGKPWHSWRVLILPYLDRKDLYDRYRFDEPWDGPNNSRLHGEIVRQYHCPSDYKAKAPATDTSYVVVVGAETAFPGNRSVKLDQVAGHDGCGDTLMVVEMCSSGIHWMQPRDLDMATMRMAINPKDGIGISSGHPGKVNVSFVDGHSQSLPNDTPPEKLRAILTIAGGEKVKW